MGRKMEHFVGLHEEKLEFKGGSFVGFAPLIRTLGKQTGDFLKRNADDDIENNQRYRLVPEEEWLKTY
jgi:hypothetical protein